jgi:PadR family transcriptional regulator, regulatory protein PadR
MGGKIRITLQTLQVLRVLLTDPMDEHYGLEISRGSGLATGSIYPILTRLETAGWITSSWEEIDESREGRRRRRYYRFTEDGAQQAREAVLDALSELAVPAAHHHVLRPGGAFPKEAPT